MTEESPLLAFDLAKSFSGFELRCRGALRNGITAIYGPSGSGKTTLLGCVAGLTTPDEGTIDLLGARVFDAGQRKNVPPEKRRLGYVFQEPALFPHKSVLGNISYGYDLTPAEERKTDPPQLLDLFSLSELVDRDVSTLSGGERQRVALARALATSPRMLLLDEPMAALDVRLRGVLIRYLKRIWNELNTPIVLVSHSISEVFALAEEVLVLVGGRVLAQVPPTSALFHPDVGAIADYGTFENLLEAEVVERSDEEGLVRLKVGNVLLSAFSSSAREGETVTISLRAGDVILALEVPSKLSAQNAVAADIENVATLDGRVLVYLDIGVRLVVEITAAARRDLALEAGQRIFFIAKSSSIIVMADKDSALDEV